MNGGRDDVRRSFVRELDDVLAEIGLHRRHAGLLERLVQVDFFRRHRLRLHGHDGAGPSRDV